jgi:tRNA 2-selenouridine synthase
MPDTADSADYRRLLAQGVPLMDVRAPVEFCRGAFPGAVNLPLMVDDEREYVGKRYKDQGQQAAIALGHQLVSGPTRGARMEAWADFARAHPDGYLYCFRGGLRSQIVQQWLREDAGIAYPRVAGGYKGMRTFLLDTLDAAARECEWLVVGGMTGSGKTELLTTLGPGAVDLEGHARHRGSSFGARAAAQPAQIDFENGLAVDLLRQREQGRRVLAVEDEGRFIGSRDVPQCLYARMQRSPVVWIDEPFEARVERVLRDYVVGLEAEFVAALGGHAGFEAYAGRLRQALAQIERRLGGDRHARLSALLEQALASQQRDGMVDEHRLWIAALLTDYYDPMYAYQQARREQGEEGSRVVFRGDRAAVLDYLRDRMRA